MRGSNPWLTKSRAALSIDLPSLSDTGISVDTALIEEYPKILKTVQIIQRTHSAGTAVVEGEGAREEKFTLLGAPVEVIGEGELGATVQHSLH